MYSGACFKCNEWASEKFGSYQFQGYLKVKVFWKLKVILRSRSFQAQGLLKVELMINSQYSFTTCLKSIAGVLESRFFQVQSSFNFKAIWRSRTYLIHSVALCSVVHIHKNSPETCPHSNCWLNRDSMHIRQHLLNKEIKWLFRE